MADCCWGKACCVHHLKSVRNKREKWSSRQNHTFLSKTALILFFLTSQHWDTELVGILLSLWLFSASLYLMFLKFYFSIFALLNLFVTHLITWCHSLPNLSKQKLDGDPSFSFLLCLYWFYLQAHPKLISFSLTALWPDSSGPS